MFFLSSHFLESEITPHYTGYWGGPWGYWGYPSYYHDWNAWHWGGWGYNRRIYHALQNLWVGNHLVSDLPYWLHGAVTLDGDDYDVNVNALITSFTKEAESAIASKDSDALRRAKNILATHLMIEQGNTDVLYNLARVDSLLGNHSTAMTWLKKAAAAGFNDVSRLEKDADLNRLHGQASWSDVVCAVRTNKGPVKKSEPIPSGEKFRFKFGAADETERKNSKESSSAPAPAQKQEEPKAAKPATGGFLFSLPGAQPEKPKEPEKPAPKQGGFLFSLPGAAAPSEPAKQPEPEKKPEEKPVDPMIAEKAKYAEQLDALHSMGFLDDSLLVGFLEKFKGNVDDVLTELLG